MAKYLDEDGLKHLWSKIEDKFVDNDELSLSYDGDKTIKLTVKVPGAEAGTKEEKILGSIDATKFIKDGMLQSVEIVEATETDKITINGEEKTSGKFIKFTWNENAEIDPVYVALSDIATPAEPNLTTNTTLTEGFTVTGVTVGNLTNGKEFKKGDSIDQILRQMLMKELGFTVTNPSITLTGTPSTKTYEVGETVNVVLTKKFNDGEYKGVSGYSYNQPAGCEEDETYDSKYYKNTISNVLEGNTDSLTIPAGSTSYYYTSKYTDSKITPVTNFGNKKEDQKIKAATVTSNAVTFNGYYKYYLGYGKYTNGNLTTTQIKSLTDVVSGFITEVSTKTIVGNTAKTSNGDSIVLAIPKEWELTQVKNDVNAPILDSFSVHSVVEYELPNHTDEEASTKTYNVYIYPITNNVPVNFNNMVITKTNK